MANERATDSTYLDRLIDSPRVRLQRWDIPDDQLFQVEKTRIVIDAVTFRAPANGVVIEKTAVAGKHVEPGETLYRLADLSSVWVEASLSESDSTRVSVGNAAIVSLDVSPEQQYAGHVVHIYPYVSESTRTVKARIAVKSGAFHLKPGMLATVRISSPSVEGLVVPTDAVVDSGDRQIVFVKDGEGYVEPRQVSVGLRSDGRALIREGLQEGESVAKSGAFLLDSESQMGAALEAYRTVPHEIASSGDSSAPRVTVRIATEPPRVGANSFEVHVADTTGAPVSDAEVSLALSMPAMPSMNMPAMHSTIALTAEGRGVYRGAGFISMAGRWDVAAFARRRNQSLGSAHSALIVR
jgi:hypothetical protein